MEVYQLFFTIYNEGHDVNYMSNIFSDNDEFQNLIDILEKIYPKSEVVNMFYYLFGKDVYNIVQEKFEQKDNITHDDCDEFRSYLHAYTEYEYKEIKDMFTDNVIKELLIFQNLFSWVYNRYITWEEQELKLY